MTQFFTKRFLGNDVEEDIDRWLNGLLAREYSVMVVGYVSGTAGRAWLGEHIEPYVLVTVKRWPYLPKVAAGAIPPQEHPEEPSISRD